MCPEAWPTNGEEDMGLGNRHCHFESSFYTCVCESLGVLLAYVTCKVGVWTVLPL